MMFISDRDREIWQNDTRLTISILHDIYPDGKGGKEKIVSGTIRIIRLNFQRRKSASTRIIGESARQAVYRDQINEGPMWYIQVDTYTACNS
jgi:hypothetical protein